MAAAVSQLPQQSEPSCENSNQQSLANRYNRRAPIPDQSQTRCESVCGTCLCFGVALEPSLVELVEVVPRLREGFSSDATISSKLTRRLAPPPEAEPFRELLV